MILAQDKNRLLIFVFYDKDGIVDRYVPYLLSSIKSCVSDILIVVNGALTGSGRAELAKTTPHILIRENKGYDIWGYKAGLEFIGWDKLAAYDEVILMNDSVAGPLYPFSEMFTEMASRDVDFWGITMYHGLDYDPYGRLNRGCIHEHIQSYFTAVRKSMFSSDKFISYWENLPEIKTYEDAIVLHEIIFTKEFSDLGFAWDVYADTRDNAGFVEDPSIFNPVGLIRDKKCPVIKKRCFFVNYRELINICSGETSVCVLDYLRAHTEFDTDMIFENILRTQNQLDISRALSHSFVLPAGSLLTTQHIKERRFKVALVFHAFYDDYIDYFFRYVDAMPDDADIFFTTDTQEKKDNLTAFCAKMGRSNVSVIIAKNRGRGESALLIAAKEIIFSYDYVCFAHVKKSDHTVAHGLSGISFAEKCYGNILASKDYVENVLSAFEENPKLGLLSPPPPIHTSFYYTVAQGDWMDNYYNTKALAGRLGLNVDISQNKAPVAPLGGMFWFRTRAMKKLFEYNWKYDDFPEEPVSVDGTILHAIERIYPYVVQDAGYYPARIYSDFYAPIELAAMTYYLSSLTGVAYELFGIEHFHCNLINTMRTVTADKNALLEDLQQRLDALHEHCRQLQEKHNILQAQHDMKVEQYENALKHISIVEDRIDDLLNSTSWKITAPLRAVTTFLKRSKS